MSEITHGARACVRNAYFDSICGAIICANAVISGIETEVLAQSGSSTTELQIMQWALNSWYLMELMLRIWAYGHQFWCGEDKYWNLFDTFLILSVVMDVLESMIGARFQVVRNARVLRAVRLFRIVRTLRIIRTLKYVREFRKMVYSLMSSVQTLFWSCLLMFGVMYTFALWFTQSAAHYSHNNGSNAGLERYYSSFGKTMYSLFGAVSDGYSWHVLVDPWIAVDDHLSVALFLLYITTVIFGLLNIVTSVFVESAMHATRHFQDLLMDARKKDLEMYTYHLERIFRKIDTDNGGTISFDEMNEFLTAEHSELPAYLEALGISSDDVWVLFKLLDRDSSGEVDIHEFCAGCLQLKGDAKSFDVNCMIYESRAMAQTQSDFMEFVEDRLESLTCDRNQLMFDIDRCLSRRFDALQAKRLSCGSVQVPSAALPMNSTTSSICSDKPKVRTPLRCSPRDPSEQTIQDGPLAHDAERDSTRYPANLSLEMLSGRFSHSDVDKWDGVL
jgi:hypothetical protein